MVSNCNTLFLRSNDGRVTSFLNVLPVLVEIGWRFSFGGQSAMNPVGVTYFGPHPSASGAIFMDQSTEQGSELGGFADPCLPRQSFERAVPSNWGGLTPTTMGAQTSTTTTLTCTSVAGSAVGGPAHALYACGPQQVGLTSVHPAQQVIVSQSVELPGSFPRAWPGPWTRRAEFGNFETIWGICPLAVVSDPSLTGHKLLVGKQIER